MMTIKERIETLKGWKFGIAGGGVFALAFWVFMESSLPPLSNCSYLASPGTDFLAVFGACLCIWRGRTYDDLVVSGFGACMIVIHALQFLVGKTGLF